MSDAAAIERFLREEIGIEPRDGLDRDEDLLASDLIDSQGMMEIVAFLDERFGIAVEDADLVPENFRSVNAIAGFVASRGG